MGHKRSLVPMHKNRFIVGWEIITSSNAGECYQVRLTLKQCAFSTTIIFLKVCALAQAFYYPSPPLHPSLASIPLPCGNPHLCCSKQRPCMETMCRLLQPSKQFLEAFRKPLNPTSSFLPKNLSVMF